MGRDKYWEKDWEKDYGEKEYCDWEKEKECKY